VYCYTVDRREKGVTVRFEQWKDIIRQAQECGARWVLLAGPGEPFMDERTVSYIDYIHSLRMKPMVFTNGTFLTEAMIEYLIDRKAHVLVKLHSLNQAEYNTLAGSSHTGIWEEYVYVWRGREHRVSIPRWLKVFLHRLSAFEPAERKKYLSVESVITRYNMQSLVPLARFIRAHRLGYLFETVITRSDKQPSGMALSAEEYRAIYGRLREYLGIGFAVQQFRRCKIRQNPVVWEDGTVGSCLVEKGTLGKIQEHSLRDLWRKQGGLKPGAFLQKRINKFRHCPGREYSRRCGMP